MTVTDRARLGGPRRSAHRPASARIRIVIVTVVILCLSSGCVQELSEPSYDGVKVGCEGAPNSLIATAQSKLTVPGTLRNGSVAPGNGGATFLTVELWRRGQDEHRKGDLLTFAKASGADDQLLAVDQNARADTSWPHASFGVEAKGARESRACANAKRGTTRAQAQCEQEQGGQGGGFPGTKRCPDL